MAGRSTFLVDTSILIAHMRQKRSPTILEQAYVLYGKAVTSDIVIFELEVGAQRSGRQFEFSTLFPDMLSHELSQPVLLRAAVIQAELLSRNKVIGLPDTFIAATALEHGIPLLTLNRSDFERIQGLGLLDIPKR